MEALKKHLHLPCGSCAWRFCNTDTLQQHLCHNCTKCPAKFCSETALEKHISTHSAEQDSCGMIQDLIDLTGGIYTNENDTEHRHEPDIERDTIGNRCHFCDKQFYTEEYLRQHILRRHSKQQRDCEQLPTPSTSVTHPENNPLSHGFNTTETNNSEDTPLDMLDLSINNPKEIQNISKDKVDNVNSTNPDIFLEILTSHDSSQHPIVSTSVIHTKFNPSLHRVNAGDVIKSNNYSGNPQDTPLDLSKNNAEDFQDFSKDNLDKATLESIDMDLEILTKFLGEVDINIGTMSKI